MRASDSDPRVSVNTYLREPPDRSDTIVRRIVCRVGMDLDDIA